MNDSFNGDKKKPYSCFEGSTGSINPVRFIQKIGRNIKYAWQRIRYGYCDRDTWAIRDWFLAVVPNMLEDMRNNLHSFPAAPDSPDGLDIHGILTEKDQTEPEEKWKEILGQMAFLLREADEETCTKKNPLDEAYFAAWKEFTTKHEVEERLKTPEETEKHSAYTRVHFPDELPEYKQLSDQYFQNERELWEYRDQCKKEGLQMFEKWFWDLWD